MLEDERTSLRLSVKAQNGGTTIRTYFESAKAPPFVGKFRALRNAMLIEMQLACILQISSKYCGWILHSYNLRFDQN